jgi:hypothetical protein
LWLEESDALPSCASCGGSSFRRDSIFEPLQDHTEATAEFELPRSPAAAPGWVAEARATAPAGGRYLAYRDDESGEVHLVRLEEGWMRIGRGPASEIRLDHPSVSRRHAMIACEAPKALRVLDDRSLNGVQVNGEDVEWSRLGDGDRLTIGRFDLFVLEA